MENYVVLFTNKPFVALYFLKLSLMVLFSKLCCFVSKKERSRVWRDVLSFNICLKKVSKSYLYNAIRTIS